MRNDLRQGLQLFGASTQVDRSVLVELVGNEVTEFLTKLGLIQTTARRSEALCTSCYDGHLLPVQQDEERLFVACSKDTDRQYLKPEDRHAYSLNVRRFLALFLDAEGVELTEAHLKQSGLFWNVGAMEITGAARAIFFVANLNDLREEYLASIIARSSPTLLFLADPNNKAASLHIHAVPVLELIADIDENGIEIDAVAEATYFQQDYAIDGEDSIVLDKDIVLARKDKELLFKQVGRGRFAGRLSLYQPTVYMIEYLFNARTKDDPSVELSVLADKFASGNKRTISTYKKQINDVALEYGTKTVFDKKGRSRYRLNPRLDCCT